jgi:DNA repair protein RadD
MIDFDLRPIYQLRPYQETAVKLTLEALKQKKVPVIVIPTGGGKSLVIAELCRYKRLVEGKRILVLASRKELVRQNYEKILHALARLDERIGIYSAGLSVKEIGDITIGNVQSVYRINNHNLLNKDLIIIDEAHEINHNNEGMYRTIINRLKEIKSVEVVGLTATPYRLGHGLITTPPAIFDTIIRDESMTISALQQAGYLTNLVAKETHDQVDTKDVAIRGGEFVERELEEAVKKLDEESVIDEIIFRGQLRKKWLIFTVGIKHAERINELLTDKGIKSYVVHSEIADSDRDRIINKFLNDSETRCVVNANILTTGFDNPQIDLIALIRPTMSRGLFVQMVGRGFRIAPGKENCLVLDFAKNFSRHGVDLDSLDPKLIEPVSDKEKGEDSYAPPRTKTCPMCQAILSIATRVCPQCGYVFALQSKYWELNTTWEFEMKKKYHDKFLKIEKSIFKIEFSRNGNKMLVLENLCSMGKSTQKIRDYFMIFTPKFGKIFAESVRRLKDLLERSGAEKDRKFETDDEMIAYLNEHVRPIFLVYTMEENFMKVTRYFFTREEDE